MPLAIKVYKWPPTNVMLEANNPAWTSIPFNSGVVAILLVVSSNRKRNKLRPDGSFGSYAHFYLCIYYLGNFHHHALFSQENFVHILMDRVHVTPDKREISNEGEVKDFYTCRASVLLLVKFINYS